MMRRKPYASIRTHEQEMERMRQRKLPDVQKQAVEAPVPCIGKRCYCYGKVKCGILKMCNALF